LGVGSERDRGVGAVTEADCGRVQSHGSDFTRAAERAGRAGSARRLDTAPKPCGSVSAIAVAT
jgi:hypothetical protein